MTACKKFHKQPYECLVLVSKNLTLLVDFLFSRSAKHAIVRLLMHHIPLRIKIAFIRTTQNLVFSAGVYSRKGSKSSMEMPEQCVKSV